MRVASASTTTRERVLVADDGELLRPVSYDFGAAAWRLDSRPPIERERARLGRPFEPLSLVAPGPRISAPDDWAERHREFHVKPLSVLASSAGSSVQQIGPAIYRVQAGMIFGSTPRAASAGTLRRNLIGVHLVVELVSCDGFTIGWEGPRWHLRYAEGLSFDGACTASDWLVTPDELDGDGIVVEHGGGATPLAWSALLEFARFVNRYLPLGPHTMVLAGWPLGPTLELVDGTPALTFDAPAAWQDATAWAEHPRIGRVECSLEEASR